MSEPIPDEQLKALCEAGDDVLLGYFFKRCGPDGLRTIAKALNWTRREGPEDAARAFEKRGLKEAADILRELAESLPSAIDDNPWLEEGRDNPRQAMLWDNKFMVRRQRETGIPMKDLVEFYAQYVPQLKDRGLERYGTCFSDMRAKQNEGIARMKAERMSNGDGSRP